MLRIAVRDCVAALMRATSALVVENDRWTDW